MSRLQNKMISMEQIRHQFNHPLFPRLVEYVQEMRRAKNGGDVQRGRESINKDIFEMTGLLTNIVVYDTPSVNAWVTLPIFSTGHVFHEFDSKIDLRDYGEVGRQVDIRRYLKDMEGNGFGRVDLENVKVSGICSETLFEIGITISAIRDIRAEVAAALLAHELGHCVTFWIKALAMARTNAALTDIVKTFIEINDTEAKFRFIDELNVGLNSKLPKELANVKKKEDLAVIVHGEFKANNYSELDSLNYDFNTSEFLADQFVTRIGGGEYITEFAVITGMGLMTKSPAWMTHMFNGALFTLGTVSTFGVWGVLLCVSVVLSTSKDRYDSPYDRIQRNRRELINRISKTNMDKREKKELVEYITALDKELAVYRDDVDTVLAIKRWFSSEERREKRMKELQIELEKLANNDLYLSAAKLELLR